MPIAQPMPTPVSHTDIANRTRHFMLPALYTNEAVNDKANSDWGMDLPDAVTTKAFGWGFVMPDDYASGGTAKVVTMSANAGDVVLTLTIDWAAEGEHPEAAGVGSNGTITIVANEQNHSLQTTLTAIAIGDVMRWTLTRTGGDGSDTLAADLNVVGLLVEYTADM